uniref:Uncharacterized protein n=1 Tax=Sphaerodactylus townsendi TaxID=933632 RepID=A0ACB8EM98_9SAUR
MGSAQICGFVAVSFLILTLLTDSSAACNCGGKNPTDLQQQFCTSDIVATGKFVGAVIGDPDWFWVRYDFQPTEVFKKPDKMFEINSLYTQLVGTTCSYRHYNPFNDDEYISTGYLAEHRIIITLCSFIKPWNQITRGQRRGLVMIYAKRCNRMTGFFDEF